MNGAWSIQGGGGDIWGTSDAFRLVNQTLAGDGYISAHLTSQTNTNVWAKAGVMMRQSTDPGSPYYAVFVTPGNGIVVQYRTTQGGTTSQIATTGTAPTYLMMARMGTTMTAYTSSDGATWSADPWLIEQTLSALSGTVLVGLAVTSHNTTSIKHGGVRYCYHRVRDRLCTLSDRVDLSGYWQPDSDRHQIVC